MPMLDALERGALFRLTRFLAFIVILVLALGLVLAGFNFAGDFLPQTKQTVTFDEIESELHPSAINGANAPDTRGDTSSDQSSLQIPFILQPYFTTAQNREILDRHLAGLDSSERQEYLSNLADVVSAAKARNEDVDVVINKYLEMKDSRLQLAKDDHSARTLRQLYIVGGAISTLFLIALCSLILVLLAIERNTRRQDIPLATH